MDCPECKRLAKILSDPAAVEVNLARGTIAMPSSIGYLKELDYKYRELTEWYDMHSAPKDGTWVLVRLDKNDKHSPPAAVARWFEAAECWGSNGIGYSPNAWRPLPLNP